LQAIALHLTWSKEETRQRKKALGLQLLVWIGCSSKMRGSGEKRKYRGNDRSAEKQLAASMNREQAEREGWLQLAGAPSWIGGCCWFLF
jgi:hypothetical protein